MTPSDTDSPEDVPEKIAAALEESSDSQLREIIHYAQQLLQDHPPVTDEIESREGKKIVRVEDHDAYRVVVVENPDETGEARGPFAYRVSWDPGMDDEEGQYEWHYLGRVHGEGGDGRDD